MDRCRGAWLLHMTDIVISLRLLFNATDQAVRDLYRKHHVLMPPKDTWASSREAGMLSGVSSLVHRVPSWPVAASLVLLPALLLCAIRRAWPALKLAKEL